MNTVFIAHSANSDGIAHGLQEHLASVSLCAASFARTDKQKHYVQLAAMLHDFGKYLPAFQKYLCEGGARGSVPHARWGAMLARCLKAEEASFAIDGHHSALPNYNTWAFEHTHVSPQDEQQLTDLLCRFKADTGLTDNDLAAMCSKTSGSKREKDVRTRFIFPLLAGCGLVGHGGAFFPRQKGAQG